MFFLEKKLKKNISSSSIFASSGKRGLKVCQCCTQALFCRHPKSDRKSCTIFDGSRVIIRRIRNFCPLESRW